MKNTNLAALIADFLGSYDSQTKDRIWQDQSDRFNHFWRESVMHPEPGIISDADCDQVIRILDRNGKGNTKGSEAVAKAMIPQGAWRRMFNEFHSNRQLGSLVERILVERDPPTKALLIDELYAMNAGQRNNLTGPSGNAVCAFLAAHDPMNNLSVISLKDRRALLEFVGAAIPFDWDKASMGTKIVESNEILLRAFRELGLTGSARTVSEFCYSPLVQPLWKGEHTVNRIDKSVSVTVPTVLDDELNAQQSQAADLNDEIRESLRVQALIARIGASMGFAIWLPRADRGRVFKAWTPDTAKVLEELPLGYDPVTMKTIEQIDVLWVRRRTIVRAFEVEHTTSIYSGLLRMADLVALQSNIAVKLHIVAPSTRRDKVIEELRRPVFSLLEGRPLTETCTYLSYDSIREMSELHHLSYMTDKVIEDYEDYAGDAE